MGQPPVSGPVVIFIGPPGSGKTSQAKIAAKNLKVKTIVAEDLIAANPDTFKRSVRPGITGMNPRTDPALNGLFGAAITSGAYKDGVVVDGYPATKEHLDYLRGMVINRQIPNPTVLRLDISDDDLRKRLGKSADATFEQLLKDYHRELDMAEVYFPGARIVKVDGKGKPDKVAKRIRRALAEPAPPKTGT